MDAPRQPPVTSRYVQAPEVLPQPHLGAVGVQPRRQIGCHPLAIFRWMVDWSEYPTGYRAVTDLRHPRGSAGKSQCRLQPPTEYMQYLATAGVPVTNVSSPYCMPRVALLNTWHGTLLSTLGRSMWGGWLDYENLQRNFQLSTRLMAPNELRPMGAVEDHDLL